MSEADELFDELNYIKEHDNKRRIVYKRGFDKIEFLHKYKEIAIDTTLNVEELKAINLKCKEFMILQKVENIKTIILQNFILIEEE